MDSEHNDLLDLVKHYFDAGRLEDAEKLLDFANELIPNRAVEKCTDFVVKAIDKGENGTARRFIRKCEQLGPDDTTKELLVSLLEQIKQQPLSSEVENVTQKQGKDSDSDTFDHEELLKVIRIYIDAGKVDEASKLQALGCHLNPPLDVLARLTNFLNELNIESNSNDKEDKADPKILESEAELYRNDFALRKRVLEMGIQCRSTPIRNSQIFKFGAENRSAPFMNGPNFKSTETKIQNLIQKAEEETSSKDYEGTNVNLSSAEDLCFTNFPKAVQKVPSSNNDRSPVGTAGSNEASGSSNNTPHERVSTVVSYTVTVPVDDHDIRNYIARGEEAFKSGDLDKSERLLLKAEGYKSTQNAKDLLLKIAELRKAREASAQPPPEDNLSKRDRCLVSFKNFIAAKDFINARHVLKIAMTLDPQLDAQCSLEMVEDAIWKTEKILILERFALQARDNKKYKEAMKYVDELLYLEPDPVYNIFKQKLRADLETQRQVNFALELAKKCLEENNFGATKKFLNEAKSKDPEADRLEVWTTIQKELGSRCLMRALQVKADATRKVDQPETATAGPSDQPVPSSSTHEPRSHTSSKKGPQKPAPYDYQKSNSNHKKGSQKR